MQLVHSENHTNTPIIEVHVHIRQCKVSLPQAQVFTGSSNPIVFHNANMLHSVHKSLPFTVSPNNAVESADLVPYIRDFQFSARRGTIAKYLMVFSSPSMQMLG
jgi:hypothetical protein